MPNSSHILRTLGLIVAASLIVASFPLAGHSVSAQGAKRTTFTLVIGGLEPVTGDLSTLAQPLQTGAQVAIKQINKALKADKSSVRVQFKIADSQGDATAAVSGARQLLSEGATCINGPATT